MSGAGAVEGRLGNTWSGVGGVAGRCYSVGRGSLGGGSGSVSESRMLDAAVLLSAAMDTMPATECNVGPRYIAHSTDSMEVSQPSGAGADGGSG